MGGPLRVPGVHVTQQQISQALTIVLMTCVAIMAVAATVAFVRWVL